MSLSEFGIKDVKVIGLGFDNAEDVKQALLEILMPKEDVSDDKAKAVDITAKSAASEILGAVTHCVRLLGDNEVDIKDVTSIFKTKTSNRNAVIGEIMKSLNKVKKDWFRLIAKNYDTEVSHREKSLILNAILGLILLGLVRNNGKSMFGCEELPNTKD